MSQFQKSYKILYELEFNSNPKKFLHKNISEKTITLGGIYKHMHPKSLDWNFVEAIIQICESDYTIDNQKSQIRADMERASVLLYADEETRFSVFKFFKQEFWESIKMDEVHSQKIANRIFCMAVVSGKNKAVKLAQKILNILQDGIIGQITVKSLNRTNEMDFIFNYDIECKKYFTMLGESNEDLERYVNGWHNRIDRISLLENDESFMHA